MIACWTATLSTKPWLRTWSAMNFKATSYAAFVTLAAAKCIASCWFVQVDSNS